MHEADLRPRIRLVHRLQQCAAVKPAAGRRFGAGRNSLRRPDQLHLFHPYTADIVASRPGSARPSTHVLPNTLRGAEKHSINHNSWKERSRVGEADPAMRENRQVFPHT
jgi:hypothetical protein